MKKTLAVAFAVCSAVYGGEDQESNENVVDSYENTQSARDVYAGAYVAGGISFQHNDNDVKVSDDLADSFVGSMKKRGTSQEASVLMAKNLKLTNSKNLKLNGKNSGKVGGSVGVGYGKFVKSNIYVGADLTVDISGKSSKSSEDKRTGAASYRKTTVKNNGVFPTLAVKVGGYIPAVDSLVYARIGAALVNAEVENESLKNKIKLNKVTPVLGLGFEKKVAKHFSVKFEGDYRFAVEKKQDCEGKLSENDTDIFHASEKAEVKGYSLRLMGVYHF